MKIFKQKEIDEAFILHNNSFFGSEYYYSLDENEELIAKVDFRAGIAFAESKIEEIATEFVEWVAKGIL
jgi:hypothetical protein